MTLKILNIWMSNLLKFHIYTKMMRLKQIPEQRSLQMMTCPAVETVVIMSVQCFVCLCAPLGKNTILILDTCKPDIFYPNLM